MIEQYLTTGLLVLKWIAYGASVASMERAITRAYSRRQYRKRYGLPYTDIGRREYRKIKFDIVAFVLGWAALTLIFASIKG